MNIESELNGSFKGNFQKGKKNKTILVTGGAGYIGLHMAKLLKNSGYKTIIFDNLSKGHAHFVSDAETFIIGDLKNTSSIKEVFINYAIDAVIHFAGFIEVEESVKNPIKFYINNIANTLNLIEVMLKYDVKKFIFSSTAAIYGEPEYIPIDEKHQEKPLNPYGRSKLFIEHSLKDMAEAYGLNYAILRYFNASGADLEGKIGECHQPETHLIPLVLEVAEGKRESISIFGDDYPTPDGTCIRDYIHVIDLCQAHLLALEKLFLGGKSDCYNLGSGCGFSVKEIIDGVSKITGRPIPTIIAPRRSGDPAILIADSTKAIQSLGWKPRFSDIQTIIRSAWKFKLRFNSTEIA